MSSTVLCTAPWNSIYLQWDRIAVCCYLAFEAKQSYVFRTKPWEAWERFDDIVMNNEMMLRLRADMRMGVANKVCQAQTRCSACQHDKTVDVNSNQMHPTCLTVSVTERCQARCYYCSRWHGNKPQPEEPSIAQIEKLMAAARRLGFPSYWYGGGDPLAMADDKLGVYMEPLNAGSDVHIFTNGIGLTENRWSRWFSKPKAYVQITLDTMDPALYRTTRGPAGASTIHAQLYRVLAGQDVSRVRLTCTVTTATLDSVAEVIRFAHKLGIREVVPNPVSPSTAMKPGENMFGSTTTVEILKKTRNCADSWKQLAADLGISLVCVNRFYSTLEAAERRFGVKPTV